MKTKVDLLLDSGAFGAWKRGLTLDIDAYIAYVKAHEKLVWNYVNLDVIPGDKGRMIRTPESVEASASQSYTNLQRMKDAGLRPIPVFHQGESFKWLNRLVEDGETYIGISPYLRSAKSDIRAWLDRCFTTLTDTKGRPLVKTHGFGLTSTGLVARYPWFSVDSTTWVLVPAYGKILIPPFANGQHDYKGIPTPVGISGVKLDEPIQLGGPGRLTQQRITDYIAEAGVSLYEARNTATSRMIITAYFFRELEKACRATRFEHRTVAPPPPEALRGKDGKVSPLNFIFASSPHAYPPGYVLNRLDIRRRLLSYFDLREKPEGFIERYVTTGLPVDNPAPIPKKWSNARYRTQRKVQLAERIHAPVPEE